MDCDTIRFPPLFNVLVVGYVLHTFLEIATPSFTLGKLGANLPRFHYLDPTAYDALCVTHLSVLNIFEAMLRVTVAPIRILISSLQY